MKKLLFLYDSLMLKRIQNILRLPIQFVSYGYTYGSMYFLNDGKKRRHFLIKGTRRCVYGAIYVIEDYEEFRSSLHSFYNSSATYTNQTLSSDLYVEDTAQVTPISFNSIQDFEIAKIQKGEPVECNLFCGNSFNTKVDKSIKHGSYYKKSNGLDAVSFLQLIKEKQDEQKRNEIVL